MCYITISMVYKGRNNSPNLDFLFEKGEVSELRQLLRAITGDRDINKKRDAVKKTIAYMTLGIDVSRLFGEMVMLCATNDLVH